MIKKKKALILGIFKQENYIALKIEKNDSLIPILRELRKELQVKLVSSGPPFLCEYDDDENAKINLRNYNGDHSLLKGNKIELDVFIGEKSLSLVFRFIEKKKKNILQFIDKYFEFKKIRQR